MANRVSVSLDKKALEEVTKALRGIQKDMRGSAMQKALKKGSDHLKKTAQQKAQSMVSNSKTIRKSIQDVKGKYATKERPYRVIQHRDKAYDTERIYSTYRAKRKTNWSKIGHLVLQGVGHGTLLAGQSIRHATAGRSRIKLYTAQGNPNYRRRSTTGKHFVVTGADGRPHPIQVIRHGGTPATPYFDTAAKIGFDKASKMYKDGAMEVFGNYREKFIARGFRNT